MCSHLFVSPFLSLVPRLVRVRTGLGTRLFLPVLPIIYLFTSILQSLQYDLIAVYVFFFVVVAPGSDYFILNRLSFYINLPVFAQLHVNFCVAPGSNHFILPHQVYTYLIRSTTITHAHFIPCLQLGQS